MSSHLVYDLAPMENRPCPGTLYLSSSFYKSRLSLASVCSIAKKISLASPVFPLKNFLSCQHLHKSFLHFISVQSHLTCKVVSTIIHTTPAVVQQVFKHNRCTLTYHVYANESKHPLSSYIFVTKLYKSNLEQFYFK